MTIKQIERIRMLLLSGGLATTILTKANIADLVNVSSIFVASYNLSILTGFHLEQLTKDYEQIESVYRLIISNIVELLECYGIEKDPVKVFAMFTHLYRSGYLSTNKDFLYSLDMKDLPCLNGTDVVRGRGVCRSISSMFTDVCNMSGLTAANISVKVSSKCLDRKEKLSLVDLKSEKEDKKIVKIVGKALSVLPIANHLVTVVSDGKKVGVFDPTNDVYMNMRSLGKYEFINDTGATMSYKTISNVVPLLFGQMNTKANLFQMYKYSKMNQVSYEEYKKAYKEVLEIIKSNPFVLEAFYEINKQYYEYLATLCNQQNGMIKRMIPIIPNKRKK